MSMSRPLGPPPIHAARREPEHIPPSLCVACNDPTDSGGSFVIFRDCRISCSGTIHSRCLAPAWLNSRVDRAICPFCSHQNALSEMEARFPPIKLPSTQRKPTVIGQGVQRMGISDVVFRIIKGMNERKTVPTRGDFSTVVKSLYGDLKPPLRTTANGDYILQRLLTFLNNVPVSEIAASGVSMEDLRAVSFAELDAISHFRITTVAEMMALEAVKYGFKNLRQNTDEWSQVAASLVHNAHDVHSLRDKIGFNGDFMARTGVRASHILAGSPNAKRLVTLRVGCDALVQMGLSAPLFLAAPFDLQTWKVVFGMRLEHAAMIGLGAETLKNSRYTLTNIVQAFADTAQHAEQLGFARVGVICN